MIRKLFLYFVIKLLDFQVTVIAHIRLYFKAYSLPLSFYDDHHPATVSPNMLSYNHIT